ncbi:hypothetical protein [Kribbella karoonensis]|uniref:hypothetical protein n=1 Tax=Kribbella karoonensis TaxID=324851 RepID=UPI0031DCB709
MMLPNSRGKPSAESSGSYTTPTDGRDGVSRGVAGTAVSPAVEVPAPLVAEAAGEPSASGEAVVPPPVAADEPPAG